MSDISSNTPDSNSSIINALDPDLAAAYKSGNPAVMQAVANGMTTSAMIVNDLIRTGASMSNMPPAIVQMVTERRVEMEKQAEADNARIGKLAAGVAGAYLSGSNIAQGGEYGEGRSDNKGGSIYSVGNPPTTAQYEAMSDAEKSAYRQKILNTTYAEFVATSHEDKKQTAAIAIVSADDLEKKNSQAVSRLFATAKDDEDLAATPSDRLKVLSAINKRIDEWRAKHPGASLADFTDDLICSKDQYDGTKLAYAVQMAAIKMSASEADLAKASALAADKAIDKKDYEEAWREIKKSTQAVENASNPETASAKVLSDRKHLIKASYDASDKALVAASGADTAEVRRATEENLVARQQSDKLVAKAELQKPMQADELEEAPTATARLSIDAQKLASAGQLQPEGVVAANDAPAPVVPEQRRPAANSGAGMSA